MKFFLAVVFALVAFASAEPGIIGGPILAGPAISLGAVPTVGVIGAPAIGVVSPGLGLGLGGVGVGLNGGLGLRGGKVLLG